MGALKDTVGQPITSLFGMYVKAVKRPPPVKTDQYSEITSKILFYTLRVSIDSNIFLFQNSNMASTGHYTTPLRLIFIFIFIFISKSLIFLIWALWSDLLRCLGLQGFAPIRQ